MIKSLIKSTVEVRVETEDDVDKLHKEVQAQAAELGVTLGNFSQTLKQTKEEEFYQVKYTLQFNTLKEPTTTYSSIEYNINTGAQTW